MSLGRTDENILYSENAYREHKKYWEQQVSLCREIERISNDVEDAEASYNYLIEDDVAAQLLKVCKNDPLTLYVYFVTVYQVLLSKYSGAGHVAVASPVYSKDSSMHNDLLPLVTVVNEEYTFKQLLLEIRQGILNAYNYQNFPLGSMLRENGIAGYDELTDSILCMDGVHKQIANSPVPLQIVFSVDKNRVSFVIHKTNKTSVNIQQLGHHFCALLKSAVEKPEALIRDIEYIPAVEKDTLLNRFNHVLPALDEKTIMDLFKEQVLKNPGGIALSYGDKHISYAELDRQSTAVAKHIAHSFNIRPGDFVGLMLERTDLMISCMLGILKAGAVYVPLDHSWPALRLNFIIKDSGVKVVLRNAHFEDKLRDSNVASFCIPENGCPDTAGFESPEKKLSQQDTVYIIYTSGTTGNPKGVMVSHRNVYSFAVSIREQFMDDKKVDMPLIASNTFDISLFELLLPLLSGGTAVMLDEPNIKDLFSLVSKLKQVTAFHAVPALMGQIVQYIKQTNTAGEYAHITDLYIGGDSVPTDVLQEMRSVFSAARINILYGPTENTIFVTTRRYLPAEDAALIKGSVIGKPMSTSSIYILGKHGNLMPVGVTGDIYIAGHSVSDGYLNNTDLSAQKFIEHPLAANKKMYKTGDLGRWLEDGNIEFMGRSDSQVKIRGFRIELGEIERNLEMHEEISRAIVLSKKDRDGNNYLVAYIAGKKVVNPGPSDVELNEARLRNSIREYLRERLPEYMVPSSIILLNELPLTTNNKIDKKALALMEVMPPAREHETILPVDKTSRMLADIWKEILDKEQVGMKDHFFDLGGHSLKAIQLLNRIHKHFQVKLEFKELFASPLLEQQAVLIRAAGQTDFAGITMAPVAESYPLSSAQQRLWIVSQFREGNIAYNMPGFYVFEGKLNRPALEYAFESLLERHEILRTVFKKDKQGEVRQFIYPAKELGFTIRNVSLRNESNPDVMIEELVQLELVTPFDLEKGPLIRANLFEISDEKWVFSLVMHHIICDGWSMGILINELVLFYHSYTTDKKNLPPLKIQYKDYAVWQQEQLNREDFKIHKKYWLEQLGGELPVLEIATDKPRPAIKTYKGKAVSTIIDQTVVDQIERMAREQGGTLFMGLIAAINILFSRYTDQEDIIIGVPTAGREHLDLEGQVGFYINTLALRNRFKRKNNYTQVLDTVIKNTFDAYEHQIYPFDQLITDLEMTRDISRSALFDIMVVSQNLDVNNGEKPEGTIKKAPDLAPGVQVSGYEGGNGEVASKFDLVFRLRKTEEGLDVNVSFNSDLFNEETINQCLRHLVGITSAVVTAPRLPVNELDYMVTSEKDEMLQLMDGSQTDPPSGETIITLFEGQAAQTPNKTAIAFKNREITYKELNERANRFADFLLKKYAIQPEDKIGILLERSEWIIISMLAVSKAGGGYVPVDINYPEERINYMLNDIAGKVVINTAVIEEFNKTEEIYSTENPKPLAKPENLVYIIYTSGTTGQPKGVMIEHRNVVNLLKNKSSVFSFSSEDVWTMFHSHCFDFSVWEMYGALLYGGKLVVVPEETAKNPAMFRELLKEERVTLLNQTPSAFYNLIAEELKQNDHALFLRYIIFGGEALLPAKLKKWKDKFPSVKLINMYGITETTVHVTCREITSADIESGVSNIGKPIPAVQCYILDENGRLLPKGAAGELYVGGAGVGRGYLNKEQLTTEKFIENKLTDAGGNLYRSGDKARINGDGELEYLGRIDDQVKIRGFRIELREIETALLAYPSVNDVAVTTFEPENGEKVLVAYLVGDVEFSIAAIRTHLKGWLPEYMIPGYYIQLEQLPLTANGKLNKKQLPSPMESSMETGTTHVAPRNGTEERLVKIWAEVLGREKISVSDNLFELGGDSIVAIRILNKIQKEFGELFQFVTLFECPSPELFAAYIKSNKKDIKNEVLTPEKLQIYRESIHTSIKQYENKKLERAIFILSPPRAGSTLLRVILAGHDQLFSPPELELAGFSTMSDRASQLSGKLEFFKEGLTRAVIELTGMPVEEAKQLLREKEENKEPVTGMYQWLQDQLAGRILVDKTPSYTYSPEILKSIESVFENAFYIHLARNPQALIASYKEAKMDQMNRFGVDFTPVELAELEWLNCNDNILQFLRGIPEERKFLLPYEQLVTAPESTIRDLCNKIGIAFEPKMLSVYMNQSGKMMDGLYSESKMIGDTKFLSHHKEIDENSLNKWRNDGGHRLSEATKKLSLQLGYTAEEIEYRKTAAIEKVAAAPYYELSSSQKRLWVLSQFSGGNSAYNISGTYIFEGILNVAFLENAFLDLLERHEILRTVFKENDQGEIKQFVNTTVGSGFNIPVTDLRKTDDQASLITLLVQKDKELVFNLASGPLLRAQLLQTGDSTWVFIYTIHHIISDGWSMGIMMKELMLLYNAYVRGLPPVLPALLIQYKDYAAWQHQQLLNGGLEKQKEYWLRKFSGELPVLNLASDMPRPAMKTFNGNIVAIAINKEVSAGIKLLSRSANTTLFTSLLAAVNVLLYKYTGQSDIIIGSPVAGRDQIELEDQLGFYVNVLALRTAFNVDESFVKLVENVKETVWGAYEHKTYPFDELVNDLGLTRDMSRSALFDVLVDVTGEGTASNTYTAPAMDAVDVGQYDTGEHFVSKFDLTFKFDDRKEYISAAIEYNTDLYTAGTIERMLEHLEQLLFSITTNPDLPLKNLAYFGEEEKKKVVLTFNETAKEIPHGKTVLGMFAEQVEKTPDAIAVVYNEKPLSYRELDEKSDCLANYLRTEAGVERGSQVAIIQNRTDLMIVSILGILKSGGAYVPIDITYPVERKKTILENLDTAALITEVDLAFDFDYYTGHVIAIDIQLETMTNTEKDLLPAVSDNDLAYIIHTSGSTGVPKGCEIAHSSLFNYIRWANGYYFAGTGAPSFGLFTSISFDLTITSLFCTLTGGGTLKVENSEEDLSAIFEKEFAPDNLVNSIKLTPSHINVVGHLNLKSSNIRQAIVGGEELTFKQVDILKKINPDMAIYNEYGPTEATVGCIVKEVSKDQRILIGRPIANTLIYILDEQLAPVAIGVEGEIYIAGAVLAKGYYNNVEQTEEKFIANRFAEEGKMYRTGDLGRWMPDGNIEYLGRKDEQSKIRGYRVELGEIEIALMQHPAVENAVVSVCENTEGEKFLAAYVVCREDLVQSSLKDFLRLRLPAYMVPDHYVRIEALPLNANGKVNKKLLPDPLNAGIATGAEYIAGRNEMEAALVNIWISVLGQEKIGVRDNFFELGGHSLKVIQLISYYHRAFNVKLDITSIFNHATIEEQVDLITKNAISRYAEIKNVEPAPSYILSSAQKRLWILSQFEGGNEAYNNLDIHVFKGDLEVECLKNAFDALIERHEVLRTVFTEKDNGEVGQSVKPFEELGFSLIVEDFRNTANKDECIRLRAQADAEQQFDLLSGPLFRASLLRSEDNKWVIIYAMHHIISDGWSMDIMINELFVLYNAFVKGSPNPLPPLRIQYKDYSFWQQEQLSGESLERHKNYWLDQFSGELSVLELLTDKVRPAIKTYKGDKAFVTLDADTLMRLKSISQAKGSTLFMHLFAVTNILFYRYTGQQDIIIGSPIAGREHPDLEDQIGFYINTLALRTKLKGTDSYSDILEHVKETTLNGYEHQVYPFDELVNDLKLPRDKSRSPLFDVMVVLQNAGASSGIENRALPGIEVLGYENEIVISRFDMTFSFVELNDGLGFTIVYNTDLYHRGTIERMQAHFLQLVHAVVANPSTPLYAIDYLAENEKSRLLYEYNNSTSVYPKNKTLNELFEEQVSINPDKTALVFAKGSITYASLNNKVNRMATALSDTYNIKAGDHVGVLMDYSELSIVSFLAVLKTGAAYVPLDIVLPEERLEFIIKDIAPSLLIIHSDYFERVLFAEIPVYNIDLDFNFNEEDAAAYTGVPVYQGEATAYMMYTSGSSGNPKGVVVRHDNIIRLVKNTNYIDIVPDDTILGVSNCSFDGSTFDIWGALLNGATLVIPERDLFLDQGAFSGIITQNKISIIFVTTALFNLLMDSDPEIFSGMRKVLFGGEMVSLKHVKLFFDRYGKDKLVHVYGPTENTTFSTFFPVNELLDDQVTIPIGQPVSNTKCYVLDEQLNLQPEGAIGELYLSGEGLASGYLNQPELTSSKFIENPFEASSKMYKTGDIARWQHGNIEFIGRKDEQVKVRGFRVELGEVEHALRQHPSIVKCVLSVKESSSGEKSLIAYVVSRQALNISELKDYLSKKLPPYMVPSYFIQMNDLPLNANGKIDKKLLPKLESNIITSETSLVSPKNEAEKKIRSIWSNVLEIDEKMLSVSDNFFDIGGNSLKMIRLFKELNASFSKKIVLTDLFDYTTIDQMAQYLSETTDTESVETLDI